MYQTLYYQGIKNYRIYNPGTKIIEKSEIPLQLQKKSLSLHPLNSSKGLIR